MRGFRRFELLVADISGAPEPEKKLSSILVDKVRFPRIVKMVAVVQRLTGSVFTE